MFKRIFNILFFSGHPQLFNFYRFSRRINFFILFEARDAKKMIAFWITTLDFYLGSGYRSYRVRFLLGDSVKVLVCNEPVKCFF